MKIYYYAYELYDNPGIYNYELFDYNADINEFAKGILTTLKNNFTELYGMEETNLIDINLWDEYIQDNGIQYNEGDWFPFKSICECIHNKVDSAINSIISSQEKFEILAESVRDYMLLIEHAYINDGKYVFEITLFDNSREFSEFFFPYLIEITDYENCLKPFKKRFEAIGRLIEERNFPNNDYHEGMLGEWLNIYKTILDNKY